MREERHSTCRIYSQLSHREMGTQTHGRSEEDTFLPKIAEELKHLRSLRPGDTSSPEVKQCPLCGTHYLFRDTYEYLATGSEDCQTLERLSDEEVAKLP
jgi:hypothetical protein